MPQKTPRTHIALPGGHVFYYSKITDVPIDKLCEFLHNYNHSDHRFVTIITIRKEE